MNKEIIIRWIFLLPLAFIAFVIGYTYVETVPYGLGMKDMTVYLYSNYDFGPYYILGPILHFFQFSVSSGFSLLAVIKIAPKNKIIVAYAWMGCLFTIEVILAVFFMSKVSNLSAGNYLRLTTELIGLFVGSFLAIKVRQSRYGIKTKLFHQKVKSIEDQPLVDIRIEEENLGEKKVVVKPDDIKRTEVKYEDVKRIVNNTIDAKRILEESIDPNATELELYRKLRSKNDE